MMNDPTVSGEHTGSSYSVAVTDLRAGALKFPAVLLQAITNVSPAAAVLFTFAFTVSLAGLATPWVFLITFLLILMIASGVAQLAKAFPSAGGYYTYVSATLHPRLGFLCAWAFTLFMPPVTGVILGYLGYILHVELIDNYNINVPWWIFMFIGAAVVFGAMYRGIRPSARIMLALTSIEIIIVATLSIWGFFAPGPGGFTLKPLEPSSFAAAPNLLLAIIFSLFTYSGWEGAAPIAEESVNPRRTIPSAFLYSVAFLAFLFTICSTGLLVGWGSTKVASIATSAELPPLVLAHRFWGPVWWIVLVALINTVVANSIAASNVSTRMTYAMARSGALPETLGKVHPRTKAPINAIHFQVLMFFIFGVVCALIVGVNRLYFFYGFVVTFILAFVYSLGNIGVAKYYLTAGRSSFNPILHIAFPLVSTIIMAYLVYKTFSPYPASPYNWALPAAAVWLIIGILALVLRRARGTESWLTAAPVSTQETMSIETAPRGLIRFSRLGGGRTSKGHRSQGTSDGRNATDD